MALAARSWRAPSHDLLSSPLYIPSHERGSFWKANPPLKRLGRMRRFDVGFPDGDATEQLAQLQQQGVALHEPGVFGRGLRLASSTARIIKGESAYYVPHSSRPNVRFLSFDRLSEVASQTSHRSGLQLQFLKSAGARVPLH